MFDVCAFPATRASGLSVCVRFDYSLRSLTMWQTLKESSCVEAEMIAVDLTLAEIIKRYDDEKMSDLQVLNLVSSRRYAR